MNLKEEINFSSFLNITNMIKYSLLEVKEC